MGITRPAHISDSSASTLAREWEKNSLSSWVNLLRWSKSYCLLQLSLGPWLNWPLDGKVWHPFPQGPTGQSRRARPGLCQRCKISCRAGQASLVLDMEWMLHNPCFILLAKVSHVAKSQVKVRDECPSQVAVCVYHIEPQRQKLWLEEERNSSDKKGNLPHSSKNS